MEDTLLSSFASLYALTYFGAITVVAAWEALAPRRPLTASLRLRWFGNISITIIDNALWRILFPLSAIGLALTSSELEWGLLNWLPVPGWMAFVVSVLALDLARYALHLALHRVPVLWRVHRMHHTDQDCDFTTGLRFHPLEALLTAAMYFATILSFGATPMAVVATELLTAAQAMISHGNVRILGIVDRALRLILVTPDMHRVHHSVVWRESNSNLGILFPWWDRLFGTYTVQPSGGHERMVIGLSGYDHAGHLRLLRMLVDPFVTAPASDRSTGTEGTPPRGTAEPR